RPTLRGARPLARARRPPRSLAAPLHDQLASLGRERRRHALGLAEVDQVLLAQERQEPGGLRDRGLGVPAQRYLYSVQLGPVAVAGNVANYVLGQRLVTGVA